MPWDLNINVLEDQGAIRTCIGEGSENILTGLAKLLSPLLKIRRNMAEV